MPIPLGILAVAGAGAAGGGGAFDLLETQILTSNADSVTFTGLGTLAAGYQHLQIRMVARSSNSTSADLRGTLLTFNGDTGSNYRKHTLRSPFGVESDSAAGSSIVIERNLNQGTSYPNLFGATVIDILDFASSTKNTTIRAFAGATQTEFQQVALHSGAYFVTTAVTSLSLTSQTPAFGTGSRFSLYGIK